MDKGFPLVTPGFPQDRHALTQKEVRSKQSGFFQVGTAEGKPLPWQPIRSNFCFGNADGRKSVSGQVSRLHEDRRNPFNFRLCASFSRQERMPMRTSDVRSHCPFEGRRR